MKMVIVMRTDLNMRKGKMVAQGAHAAVMCTLEAHYRGTPLHQAEVFDWLGSGQRKIVVGIESLEKLEEIEAKAIEAKVTVYKITDRGDTEFHRVPTVTCLALGPAFDTILDPITGALKLL